MFKTLLKRRKLLATAGGFLGTSALVLGVAVPAGATPAPAQNTLVIQGGSNTTYGMMIGLSSLFDQAIGCNLLNTGSPQATLDYSCSNSPQTGGENGYPVGPTQAAPFNYNQVNPYNDVVAEEPPYGSSNGINEIQYNGSGSAGSGIPAAPINIARSSRAAKSGDDGSQFVAYAEDAVPWYGFKTVPASVNGGVSCTSGITGFTDTELKAIYNESSATTWGTVASSGGITGSIPASCNSQVVDCYMAQNGSGTEATWQADMSIPTASPTCLNFEGSGTSANHVVFENEDSAIVGNPSGDDAGTALFYFSFGKFNTLCPSGKGACAPHSGFVGEVGSIDGVPVNQCTIQDTGNKLKGKGSKAKCTGTKETYFTDRQLYNVYENCGPNNTNSVPCTDNRAEQAMLNFGSSIGFICNPTTFADVDPLSPTSATYGTEIDAVITANGFYPFPLGVQGDSGAGVEPWTSAASSTEAQITNNTVTDWGPTSSTNPYYLADVSPSTSPVNNGDKGYCRVTEGT